MKLNLSNHWKTITAVVGALVAWSNIVVQSAPAHISAGEWQSGAVLLAAAFGVYVAPKP